MADSDSDGEFERFMQEDDDSLSPEPIKRRAKPSGVYTSSTASAVTSAAAALLASSRLSKSHKSKSKSKSNSERSDKKKTGKNSTKSQLSDSEEPPPSYYDDASMGRGGVLEDSEKEEDFDEEYKAREQTKREELKTLAKKASAPISMEDRVAEILKRTGSTRIQADEESGEDEGSDRESDEERTDKPRTINEDKMASLQGGNEENSKEDEEDSGSDAERSSLSDSLGMESADFEVRLPLAPKLDRPRLSLSSLDSEKFAINRDALDNELATPSRYEQQQMTFSKSEDDEDSATEKDEYGDDDFEISADISPTTDAQQEPLDASDTFGYGDDEFEETESSRQEDTIPALSESQEVGSGAAQDNEQAKGDAGNGTDYEDDAFEGEPATSIETPSNAPSEPPQSMAENVEDAATPVVDDPIVDRSSKIDALLAKYGDFYTQEDEEDSPATETSQEGALQKQETQEDSEQTSARLAPTENAITALEVSTEIGDSSPSSPPPPPPPADEEDQELQRFSLDAPVIGSSAQVRPAALQDVGSTVTTENYPPLLSAADRFRQIESHVSSLRFVQPATPSFETADSPSTQNVHPVSSKLLAGCRGTGSVDPASPPFIEPLSISFDTDLVAEDEDTQREIDEFVRSSQIIRQEKRVAARRASIARENGLTLRLQQAQRQILQLKEHIQATAASDHVQLGGGTLAVSKLVDAEANEAKHDSDEYTVTSQLTNITQAAYNKLQKEIKTQDHLIAAFQKENERLMQQLKQVRQDVHYDVHEANEELRRQIKALQTQLGEAATLGGGADLTSKAQYRVAVEARLEAEAHALALQEELAGVRLSYQQKLNEVTLELDRVKKAKVELECRYEGVDLTQVAQETQHARELQNELELCKKEHTHTLAALQKKLDWYVENQRLLDDQDEELRRLRRQVAGKTPESTPSKDQRVSLKTGGPSPARSHRRAPNDIRRIQELEGRLAELEEAMRRRHPDSLANLILASRRADEESKTRALERDYDEKLSALSRELEQAHEASETKLASFRQQQEKLLLQYRRKIKEQETQLKQLSKPRLAHRPPSKDAAGASTASDAELAKVRRFYTDKIRELERKWDAKCRALRKQQFSSLGSNQHMQEGLTYADSAVVIANLQRQIREQELELKQEKAMVEQLEAENQLGNPPPQDSPAEDSESKQQQNKQKKLEEQVADLKAQLEDSESARERLARTLSTVQTLGLARALNSEPTPTTAVTTSTPVIEPVASQQAEAELAQLKKDLEAVHEAHSRERASVTEKCHRLEKQVTEYIDKNAALGAQLVGNQREMQRLQKLAVEAERHDRSLEAQAQRVPDLEEEVLALRRELELPRTPSMVQYRSLELKVATLEQKHKLREAELKVVLDRTLTSTHLEQLSRERAHRAAIAAKNAEIASFKLQLEEILDELALLQQPSSSRPLIVPTNTSKQPQDDEDMSW